MWGSNARLTSCRCRLTGPPSELTDSLLASANGSDPNQNEGSAPVIDKRLYDLVPSWSRPPGRSGTTVRRVPANALSVAAQPARGRLGQAAALSQPSSGTNLAMIM